MSMNEDRDAVPGDNAHEKETVNACAIATMLLGMTSDPEAIGRIAAVAAKTAAQMQAKGKGEPLAPALKSVEDGMASGMATMVEVDLTLRPAMQQPTDKN